MDPSMDPMTGFHEQYSPANSAQSPGTPTSNAGSPPKKHHSRTYQACTECRKRKVRCDLGDVENPHEPPCARCKRERKNCEFATTRRKANGKRAQSELVSFDGDYNQQHPQPPKRSRHSNDSQLHYGIEQPDENQIHYVNGQPVAPFTPGVVHDLSPTSQPHSPVHPLDPETLHRSTNALKAETYDGQGTLATLVAAAEALGSQPRDVYGQSSDARPHIRVEQEHIMGLQGSTFPPNVVEEAEKRHWARFHFVRIGLLKASEAMAYIEYFYVNCKPFTPVSIPDYRDPALHQTLMEREPFLMMTILTIASRFMALNSQTHWGQLSRPQRIHDSFWKYTQKMFATINWAQEQFGGGMSGGGRAKGRNKDPLFRYGLRSITTVEALMLLCEWAPRALHFPPEDDPGELVAPLDPIKEEELEDDQYRLLNGDGANRKDTWLEPAWRCDTMIWMLLHNAKALGLEIGLFDDRTVDDLLQNTVDVPEEEIRAYHTRKIKTKDIFWAFYVQTCGRLELIGKLPRDYLGSLHHSEADVRIQEAVKIRAKAYDRSAEHPYDKMPHSARYARDPNEVTWFFWQEITAIMKSGNETMFSTKAKTRRITRSGEYRKWLHVYRPLLQDWRDEFEACELVPEPMRTILLIEYEYVRTYLHSLPLQAFVERAIASTPSKQNLDIPGSNGSPRNDSATSNGANVGLEDVRKWMQEDAPYIETLVEACQHVLALIGESKIPPEKIKHFSVRVYFRIMASAVHLLKTYLFIWHDYCLATAVWTDPQKQSFVVGAYADNVRRSMDLLEKAAHVLKTHIVDDVHIGAIFSQMIMMVTKQLSTYLKRFMPGSRPGLSRAQSRSPLVAASPVTHSANSLHPSHPHAVHSTWTSNSNGFSTPAPNGDMFMPWQNDPTAFLSNLDIYDASNASNMTVMPPPNFMDNAFDLTAEESLNAVNGSGGIGNATSMHNNYPEWVAMDFHNLVNLAANGQSNEVSHGPFGPTVNGQDLLDHVTRFDGTLHEPVQAHGLPMMPTHAQQQRMWTRS